MNPYKNLLSRLRGEQNLEKLIKRGLKIGKNCKIMGGCIIDPSHCWHIQIGDNVIIAPRVHILAHDASTHYFMSYTKVANVKIGNSVFIGAGSIILPGITVGDNVIIGAGSVVSKSIPENSVVAGAPARIVSSLQDHIKKEKAFIKEDNIFDEEYTLRNPKFSDKHRDKMLEVLDEHSYIYIK